MSKNPWPLVLVGLGSFGFLAASMAQQTDPNDLSQRVPPASIQIPDFDALDFKTRSNDTEAQWSDDDIDTAPHSNAGVRLGGDIEDITERPLDRDGRRFVNGPRRFADEARNRLRDTQPQTAQIQEIKARSPRTWGRAGTDASLETEPIRSRFAESDNGIVKDDVDPPASNRPLFDTRETAILGDPPAAISANRSLAVKANPRRMERSTTPDRTSDDPLPNTSVSVDGAQNRAGEAGDLESLGKLPLWSTMALIASIAANLFFCWIAWDAHSKYQDLVEDISDSDTRMERQTRRLRNDDGHSRRARDTDEADFLRSGVEV